MPDAKKQKSIESEVNEPKVQRLNNSIYFAVDTVFILSRGEAYRLIVIHAGRVLKDTEYRTLRGAKIAFIRCYRKGAFGLGRTKIEAEWSHSYSPDQDWLNPKIELCNRHGTGQYQMNSGGQDGL